MRNSRTRRLMALFAATMWMFGRAAAEPMAPPDPAAQGEWVAMAWIDPAALDSAAGRAAAAGIIEGVLATTWGAIGDLSAEDRVVLAKAADAAAGGRAAALWLVPRSAEGRLALGVSASVFAAGADQPELLGPSPKGDAAPLRTAAPRLGPEGFAEWPAHRAAAAELAPYGGIALELAFNVDAIRHVAGDEFAARNGPARGSGVLNALRLGNARVIGLHGRIIAPPEVGTRDPSLPKRPAGAAVAYAGPPLLTLTATWSSRAETPGRVRAGRISAGHWPLSQVGAPTDPAAGFVVAVRTTWRPLLDVALDAYGATLPQGEEPPFADRRRVWNAAHATGIATLVGGLEPWLLIDGPTDAADRGTLRLVVPLRSETTIAAGAQSLENLTNELGAGGNATPSPRWRVESLDWRVIDGSPGRIEGRVRPTPRK